ncbi:MAG: hypothetical protein ABEI74_03510 [Candidatus Pacearchaeota archaeon]
MVKKKLLAFLFLAIAILSLVHSQPLIGDSNDGNGGQSSGPFGDPNHSIETSYATGANLDGWINASFENHDAGTKLTDSEGNSINLLQFVQSDSRHEFSCAPESCEPFYSASDPEQTKSLSFSKGEEKEIGFKLDSNIDEINNFSLKVKNPNSGPSCTNQVKIDILDDNSVETGNTKRSSRKCVSQGKGKTYGCFNKSNQDFREVEMSTNDAYCQGIYLPEAPGFELGAQVKNKSGKLNITMEIYTKNGNIIDEQGAKCTLNNSDIKKSWNEVGCNIAYLVTERSKYYVCARAEEGSGNYNLKLSTGQNSCGFPGTPPSNEKAKYSIYAHPYKFGSIGTLNTGNQISAGGKVSTKIEDFLLKKNGDLNCTNGCVVPIGIKSGVKQTLDIGGKMEYDSDLGTLSNTDIYNLSKSMPTINSSYQKFYLDNANFSLPTKTGEYNYALNLGNMKVFEKNLSIDSGPKVYSVNPTQTAVGLPTTFTVSYGGKNVSEFRWKLGNLSEQTTKDNSLEKTFNEKRNLTLILTAKGTEGRSTTKIFDINVGPASKVLSNQTSKKKDSLKNLKSQISQFGPYSSTAIRKTLNISRFETEISEIQGSVSFGSDNVSDQKLLQRILSLNIPESVSQKSKANSVTLVQEKNQVSVDSAKVASGNVSLNSTLLDEYKHAIQKWALKNAEVSVSGGSFSADYGSGEQPLATAYTLDVKGPNEKYYIFLSKSRDWKLNQPSGWSETSGHYYKEASGEESVSFYSEGHSSFEDLPYFVSPDISSLNVVDTSEGTPEEAGEDFNWTLYGIIAFGILVLAGVAYYFLKKWYDKRYEDYLFPDKNKLYNLVIYIQKSKKQGKSDSEIKQALNSHWSNEQINYLLKKFKGKEVTLPSFGLISTGDSKTKKPKKRLPKKKKRPIRKRPPLKKAPKKKFPRKR